LLDQVKKSMQQNISWNRHLIPLSSLQ